MSSYETSSLTQKSFDFIVEGTTSANVWSNVFCFELDFLVLLIFNTPTLNNEIVSFESVIMPIIHTYLHKPNNKLVSAWLEHFWCTYEPWAYTNFQDSPWLKLGEATTFPLIIFYVINHEGCIQMSFCQNSQNWDF